LLNLSANVIAAQGDLKRITAMSTALELTMVPVLLRDFDALGRKRRPVGTLARWTTNTEPLLCHCVSILEARIANVTRSYAGMLCHLIGNPGRVRPSLLNPQPVVLAFTAKLDGKLFSDDEIVRGRSNTTGAQGLAERAGPIGKRCQWIV
jgi:hypothetical protein